MSYSDEQLRQAIDHIFTAYDKDNSGTLEKGEVLHLINNTRSSI